MSYCSVINTLNEDKKAIHKPYHDNHYGFPIHDDNELFARFVMEINQAGLSWETILRKEQAFRKAYDNFDIATVAGYTETEYNRLLADTGIIRNRLKINAAIDNAKKIITLQQDFGSFEKWIESHHPKTKEEWIKLFKKTFKFTGGEIVNEFLMSIGVLAGAHVPDCSVYRKIVEAKPLWMSS
jgi:DNA-3-methyladenine glycosylase I